MSNTSRRRRPRVSEAYGEDASPFRKAARPPLLERVVPVSRDLPAYGRAAFRRDALAGVTVAALALPSGMAYAELAGLSPVAGLYALLLPTVAYVVLGSSRQLIVGPEGSIAALVAATLLPLAGDDPDRYADLAALLALMVGAAFLLARLARIGWIADYFSRSVLVGYIHGVAVVLIIGQMGKLLGVSLEAERPIPLLAEIVDKLPDLHTTTVAVGAVSLALLLGLRRLLPKFPAALAVVIGAIAASWALDLAARGVATVGAVPSGLPRIHLPSAEGADLARLVPAALGIFLVSFADEILTARAFAGRHGQHVRVRQELTAMAAADAAAGLTGAFPIGASGSRTAVNDLMGVRTQVAGLMAVVAVACVLLFLTAPIAYLPSATLGAIIVSAAIGLVDTKAWRALWRPTRADAVIGVLTTVGVVVLGVLDALLLAVALSVVDTVRRSARPHDAVLGYVARLDRYADVSLHPRARITPGVLVYRLDDRLFFANARYVSGRVREALDGAPTRVAWLVFDAEALVDVDATGLETLDELVRSLDAEGTSFAVARLKQHVREIFDLAELTAAIGRDRFFPTVRAAVEAAPHPRGTTGDR